MGKRANKPIPLSILRQTRGLTQAELADEIRVSHSLIGLYETGKRKPGLDRALQIAKYFNTTVEMIQFDCRDI